MTYVLLDSIAYKKVIPIALSIIGSIYCIVFLVRFILWWFIEPYRNRQFKSKCRKLEKFFQQRTQNLERPSEIYQPSFRVRHVSLETVPVSKKPASPPLSRSYSKHYLELWQWCVAMGYLKYEHGERLNLIISDVENRYKDSDMV
ncbi:hypothetical protein K501DRAFT_266932 [Backusella circina FSU 941]|nr:hypothetical protein K501DRAFT_266932 [Backusella circina FSU 941]